MLFHAQSFVLLFLPATLALYYALARHVALREWALIAASLVFYAWWDVRFLPLLLGHIVVTWLLARAYAASGNRALLWLGVALNFASLAFFKYTSFLLDNLGALAGLALPKADIVLPIGISFFTFQCVSYLIDLKRGRSAAISAAPADAVRRAVPAPDRGADRAPQRDHPAVRPRSAARRPCRAHRQGRTLFVVGLLLKVLIADKLAPHVDRVFAAAATGDAGLVGRLARHPRLLAADLLRFLGLLRDGDRARADVRAALPDEFRHALSRHVSLRDFWRRWHMSLSRFLRDYLYIPLGGSRHGFRALRAGDDDHDGAVRAVARRGLDVRDLGPAAWRSGSSSAAPGTRRSCRCRPGSAGC